MLLRLLLLVMLPGLLGACRVANGLLLHLQTETQATLTPPSAWQRLADGLEWRILLPNDDALAQLIVVRADPARTRFRVLYAPGRARRLAEWRAEAGGASVIINANFFDAAQRAVGAVVSDGVWSGSAYHNRGGSFILQAGEARVVANRGQPLSRDSGIEQLAQGFPLLVAAGRAAYSDTSRSQRTRRTIIAQDRNGRILLLVAPLLGLSLADLSAYLASSDLEIETAVNLDGGGSTLFALPAAGYALPSFDAVPTILALYSP